VIAFWVVALIAGGAAAGRVPDRLSFDFSLPGQEGYQTEVKLAQAYNVSAYASYIPVYTAPAGEKITDHRDDLAAITAKIRQIPQLKVLDYSDTGDPQFVTADGRSSFALIYEPQAQGFADPLADTVNSTVTKAAAAQGLDVKITGYNQLAAGNDSNDGPSVLIETLLGALGALVILIFVFASFLALVPLMIAAVSILSTFLVVLGLTTFTDVSFVVQFLIALIGLGVAIDYSLLVVSRWRRNGPAARPTTTPS